MTATATRPTTARPGPLAGRAVHPWAWWGWAIGVAVASSLSTNPLFLLLLGAAVVFVIIWRRTNAPWAMSLRVYVLMGATIILIRLFFQFLFGSRIAGHTLFTLPSLALPDWAAGIRIGGAVTAEALLFTFYDALRLALMLLCVGAANTLANPKRALRSVPAALYELSVAITVALTVAPQVIESTLRIRRARRLRGGAGHGWRAVRSVVIPVLEDAIERSLALAAGMEVRGFGRTRADIPHRRWMTALMLTGACLVTFALFMLLGMPVAPAVPVVLLIVSFVLIAVALRLAGRQLQVTHYRPDPWRAPEWLTLGCGVATAGVAMLFGSTQPLLLTSTELAWPQLHPLMLVAAAFAIAPAFLTPVPPNRALQS